MSASGASRPGAANVRPGSVLWRPAPDAFTRSQLGRFLRDVERQHGVELDDYESAWRWSVDRLEDFWAAVWAHFEVRSDEPWTTVLVERTMPGAVWFPGARINYLRAILDRLAERGDGVAILSRSQTDGEREISGTALVELIGRIQSGFRRAGVGVGDRVAGFLPNGPEAIAAYLAAAGLGAVWSSVPPEMGPRSALDRLQQIEPRVLLAIDGYRWGDRTIGRVAELARIAAGLPSTRIVRVPYLAAAGRSDGDDWREFIGEAADPVAIGVPFAHPLAILFSSGTTGAPKAIVHSHGGLLLEHLKALGLQMDLGPDDTAFWFTTTGWMVWNLQVSSLLVGARLVLMDGDPNWPSVDGPWSQWAILAETRATFLGTGAAYLAACARAGLRPRERWDLSPLREINSSGSPLSAEVAAWVYADVSPDLLLAPTSGGTDICSAFVGGSPLTPVHAGEMSCRPLGVAVDSLDPEGRPILGAPGELVVDLPMPSMPVGFWGDPDGARYRSAYFDVYPGRWRHGDWLVHTERDTWVITGRSDATLNRGGVRLGSAEFYAVLDRVAGVGDSLVLHFEDASGMGTLVVAIEPIPGVDVVELAAGVRRDLRTELSPRHVPDLVVPITRVPRNLTGKRLEVPVKRLVLGAAVEQTIDLGVVVDPDSLPDTVGRIRAAISR